MRKSKLERLSVILPVYNAENYIDQCLESITKQNYSNLEIIIVDDGSTDNSRYHIKRYAEQDERIKFYFQRNKGVAAARNFALQYATGEWITFCDSDDIVPNGSYRKMIDKGNKSHADVVVGALEIRSEKETTFFKYKKNFNIFYAIYYGPSLCNRLFRNSVLKGLKFNQFLKVGEDISFLSDVYPRLSKVSFVSDIVHVYIKRDDAKNKSLTHQFSPGIFENYVKCWTMAIDSWKYLCEKNWEEYIVHITVPYLYKQMLLVPTIEGKEKSWDALCGLLSKIDWSNYEAEFQAVFGIVYTSFSKMSANEYFDYILSVDIKDRVYEQFSYGMIGFKYIISYVKEWAKYKLFKKGV